MQDLSNTSVIPTGLTQPRSLADVAASVFAETINQKLNRIASRALTRNPWDDALATGVTMTAPATPDATLTKTLPVPANNARFAYYGGTPTQFPSQNWMLFPVASVAPSLAGNLSGYLPLTPSLNAWTWAAEFETDALVCEIKFLAFSATNYNVLVDGQFVSAKTGNVPNAYSGTQYVRLDFGTTRKMRRIQFRCRGASGFGGVNVLPTASVNAPADASQALKVAITGDSYSEGQGLASPFNPDGGWTQVVGHLLGWKDIRQVAVGSTGYVATAGGVRSAIPQQIANWGFTPDVIVSAGGFNDRTFATSAIQAAALTSFQSMRVLAPKAPIFVLGSWGGKEGPSAACLASEAAVLAAYTQFNDPNSYFVPVSSDTQPWLFGTGTTAATNGSGNSDFYMSSDNVHPIDAGHEYMGRRAAAAFRQVIEQMKV